MSAQCSRTVNLHPSEVLCRYHILPAPSTVAHAPDQRLYEVEKTPRLNLLMQLNYTSRDEVAYRSTGFRQGMLIWGRRRSREYKLEEECLEVLKNWEKVILDFSASYVLWYRGPRTEL